VPSVKSVVPVPDVLKRDRKFVEIVLVKTELVKILNVLRSTGIEEMYPREPSICIVEIIPSEAQ